MLCVNDVERSAGWYRDKLGFEVVESDSEIALLRLAGGLVYTSSRRARRPRTSPRSTSCRVQAVSSSS
jgi:catechol 2,3-dioxygenase-like lactoylglutathione lyase family enzyme